MVNAIVLENAIAAIEAEPENWDQTSWGAQTACGTTMCLAGHIVHNAGYRLNFMHDMDGRKVASHTTDGKNIEVLAKDLAGLDWHETSYLFYDLSNDIDVLKNRIKNVVNGTMPEEW